MDSLASGKRSFSPQARAEQLDNSARPRRVLWAYCSHHGGGYYFYDVRLHGHNPGEKKRWENEPDMRKVQGICMLCNRTSIFFVGADELEQHRYGSIDLCSCGLPIYHKEPSPEFCRQYNAVPVECRPPRR